jgi:hypothetical protein
MQHMKSIPTTKQILLDIHNHCERFEGVLQDFLLLLKPPLMPRPHAATTTPPFCICMRLANVSQVCLHACTYFRRSNHVLEV